MINLFNNTIKIEMDPSYSVLLQTQDDEAEVDECGNAINNPDSKKGVSTTVIIIAVVVSVGGAVLIAAFVVFVGPRLRLAYQIRKSRARSVDSEMANL